jgi:hypothetical protein
MLWVCILLDEVVDMDKCNKLENKDCTFENCPIWYYKDCYEGYRESCLNPSTHLEIDLS